MKRFFDLILGLFAGFVLLIPVLLVAMAVRLTSKGPALYWSDRVGRNNVIFKMPKFRSMRLGTPAVATRIYWKYVLRSTQGKKNYISSCYST